MKKYPEHRQPDHDREQHAPRARVQIGVGILGRRPKERSRPKGGERRRARLCALGATGPFRKFITSHSAGTAPWPWGGAAVIVTAGRQTGQTQNIKKSPHSGSAECGLFVWMGWEMGLEPHDNRNHNPGLYQLSYAHHVF